MSRRNLLSLTWLSLLLGACSQTPISAVTEKALTTQASMPVTLRNLAFSAGVHPVNSGSDWQGQAFSPDGQYLLFKVYSANATRVQVDLFNTDGRISSFPLTKDAQTGLWYAAIARSNGQLKKYDFGSGMFSAVSYGFRAWGPNWTYDPLWTPGSTLGFISDVDAAGNRFNPNKLLLDPYALELNHDFVTPANLDGSAFASGEANRATDSAPVAARSLIANTTNAGWAALAQSSGTKPIRAQKDDVIYEVNVRGFTKNDPSVATNLQGTYAGAALKAQYLKALGVTAVEFLPVHETENDANDANGNGRSSTSTAGDNYWGYMTTNYFAPDRRYSSDKTPGGPTREFAAMSKAFHDAGIKVIADVVYNHSGEGGLWNSTDPSTLNLWSMRGLDNSTYYLLTNDKQYDYDITGVGNTLNTRSAQVQRLIVDSLQHLRDLGVDGFRFDLGIALGNTYDNTTNPGDTQRFYFSGTDNGTALAKVAQAFPNVFLSAEPWGLAPGGQGYQIGNFPKGWSEWNGQFRDFFRRDMNKLGVKPITPGQLISRFAGSSDLFQGTAHNNRAPYNSVNFINVHDGMTLKDVFSCNGKSNLQAWPLGPSDGGTDDEDSWDNMGNAALQRQQARNAMTVLSVSQGVPIFNGGDEFLRSLNCNNNPYNLDSTGNWLNWNLTTDQQNFQKFTSDMLKFRALHPALRRADFFNGQDNNGNGLKDVTWLTAAGNQPDGWWYDSASEHALAFMIDGTEVGDDVIYVAYNGWSDNVNFTLPAPPAGKSWYRVTDTSAWAEGASQVDLNATQFIAGNYGLNGRATLILIAR